MNIPIKTHNPNVRPEYQEKYIERELWHKLVVKIINWEDEDNVLMDKITVDEWNTYSRRMIVIDVTGGEQKALDNLEKTRKIIKAHNGFV